MEQLLAAVTAALAGASLLQLSPIRIDPWSWLGKRLGVETRSRLLGASMPERWGGPEDFPTGGGFLAQIGLSEGAF